MRRSTGTRIKIVAETFSIDFLLNARRDCRFRLSTERNGGMVRLGANNKPG